MNVIPIAALTMMLAQSVTGLWRNQILRTHRGEIDETGKDDDPDVHGVDNVTTIELEEQRTLDPIIKREAKLTKRPSASQLFKRNMRLGIMVIGLE